MIAITFVALFAVVAFASVTVLADAAVRSRNAFRTIRGDIARQAVIPAITVWFDGKQGARMPALRPVSAGRCASRRSPQARDLRPLRAAA